ncbi:hypothetical protein CHUAL_000349 [Chamberlinius hualienensis]
MVVFDNNFSIIDNLQGAAGVKLQRKFQLLFDRFKIGRKLGQGTYGSVYLAQNNETGEEVAVKIVKKTKICSSQDLLRIQREIQIMSMIHHPHIIRMYEVFENKNHIVLVMEYASGGELFDYLCRVELLEDNKARHLFRQIASAVFFCHKNMICHRDIKLENILLDNQGNAKITDFGLSNVFDENHFLSTFCGSPLYASPEMLRRTIYYGPEVDCWSLGVLLFIFVYGFMPFVGSEFRSLVKQISEANYYEPKKKSNASQLIRRMLTVSPSKRANIYEICSDEWANIGEEVPLLNYAQEYFVNLIIERPLINLSSGNNFNINFPHHAVNVKVENEGEMRNSAEKGTASGSTDAKISSVNFENMKRLKKVDSNMCDEVQSDAIIGNSDACHSSSQMTDFNGYFENLNTETILSSCFSSIGNDGNSQLKSTIDKVSCNGKVSITQCEKHLLSFEDPLASWDLLDKKNRSEVNNISSVMDAFKDPNEILQKAVELCSSLKEYQCE